jgi:hypothetical protein
VVERRILPVAENRVDGGDGFLGLPVVDRTGQDEKKARAQRAFF